MGEGDAHEERGHHNDVEGILRDEQATEVLDEVAVEQHVEPCPIDAQA